LHLSRQFWMWHSIMSVVVHRVPNFWTKYENVNLKITCILISIQLLHLYWLTTDVVLHRITGQSYLGLPPDLLPLFIVVDCIEVPASVSGITLYLFSILKHKAHFRKNIIFLILLAIQIIHIFWITDEVLYCLCAAWRRPCEVSYIPCMDCNSYRLYGGPRDDCLILQGFQS
jgi:hypothetical protein